MNKKFIGTKASIQDDHTLIEKKDYSTTCNKDDDDITNPCWHCNRFLFPIGCMLNQDMYDALDK